MNLASRRRRRPLRASCAALSGRPALPGVARASGGHMVSRNKQRRVLRTEETSVQTRLLGAGEAPRQPARHHSRRCVRPYRLPAQCTRSMISCGVDARQPVGRSVKWDFPSVTQSLIQLPARGAAEPGVHSCSKLVAAPWRVMHNPVFTVPMLPPRVRHGASPSQAALQSCCSHPEPPPPQSTHAQR